MSLSPRSPRSFPDVSPKDVLAFTKPTKEFLCPLSANKHQIEFLEFTISDYATKNIIFMSPSMVEKDKVNNFAGFKKICATTCTDSRRKLCPTSITDMESAAPDAVGRDFPPPVDVDLDLGKLDENAYRLIKYEFSEDVLRLPSIQTSLVFSVGEEEVSDFRMVERHYFRNQLVKSYDFQFGFCIPASTNTWDAVYQVPALDEELMEEMIANPFETKSDSFYFVDDKLIMHNKASYKYIPEDTAQAKKSYESRYAGAKGAKKQASKYDSDEEEEVRNDMDNDDGSIDGEGSGGEQKAGGKYDDDEGEEGEDGRGEDDPWSKEADYY